MWIVFIEINPEFHQAFNAARELGLKILLISKNAASAKTLTICDSYQQVPAVEFEDIVSALKNSIGLHEVAAFWALRDALVPLAAKLTKSHALNKHGYSEAVVRLTKNKFAMREALGNSPYNPKYELLKDHHRPMPDRTIVIKPVLGYASIGVEKVSVQSDFAAALVRCQSVLKSLSESLVDFETHEDYDAKNALIVEEFVDGEEFSVEVFASRHKIQTVGVCSKSEMKAPFFEEVSYCMPAETSHARRQALSKAAVDVMTKLGLTSGMAHVEFRMKGEQPILLDIGLRLGGSGLTHDLVEASSGVNIVKAVLAELCGIELENALQSSQKNIGLLSLFQVKNGGRVRALPDWRPALQNLGLASEFLKVQFFVEPGTLVTGYPKYSGLPGFAMFQIQGQDAAAYQRARDVLKLSETAFAIEYSDATIA